MLTRVQKVWEQSWADSIAYSLVYGSLGSDKARGWVKAVAVQSDRRELAGQFAAARYRWNQYVTSAEKSEHLSEQRAHQMRNCRVAGVKLNRPNARYSCGDRFCPYCYYRYIRRLLPRIKAWADTDELILLSWQIEIVEDAVLDEVRALQTRHYPCAYVRKRLLPHLSGVTGLHASRLWVEVENKVARYFHQFCVIGPRVPDLRGQMRDDPDMVAPHSLERLHLPPAQALGALRYCPGWIDVDWTVGRWVVDWNRAFRFHVMK
jgi:hypothetical protein